MFATSIKWGTLSIGFPENQLRKHTLSNLDKKDMKSAHSLTLSNDCKALSTCCLNRLYFESFANSDAAAAIERSTY